MNKLAGAMLLVLAVTCAQSRAEMALGGGTTIAFATVEEGREILAARDDFVQCMSPFDRSARMKTDKDVSENEYLEFVGGSVLPWNDAEKEKVASAFQGVREALASLSLQLPGKVFFIKTDGHEEGGAAYTRANAIIFPEGDLAVPVAKMQETICHELFHVMSRANPELRDELYAAIGFMKCGEVDLPQELKLRKITNPDAPWNDHCIQVKVKGKDRWAVPIIFSGSAKYDAKKGGEFFDYLQFQLILIERNDTPVTDKLKEKGQKAKLVDVQEISGFFEQVGTNTEYIIHPEEILADNFAMLAMQQREVPSPEIIEKVEAILKEKGPAQPGTPAATGEPRP